MGNALGNQSSAVVTILNDDVPPPPPTASISFSDSEFQIKENGTPIKAITVNRIGALDKAVSAAIAFTNGLEQ